MRWVRAAAVGALVVCGLYAIGDALNVWAALGVGAAALLAVWRYSWRGVTLVLLRLIGAILVAFLAMVGVAVLLNLLLDLVHHIHPFRHLKVPIAVGLLIALTAFALAAYWYLRRAGWPINWSAAAAAGIAVVVVLVAPYLFGRFNSDTTQVADAHLVASQLDVLIVGDGSPHPAEPEPPPSPALGEFDVTYSVGYADGSQVRWTLLDGKDPAAALAALAEGRQRQPQAGQPTARPEADHVLLLYVDGTAPVVAEPAALPDVAAQADEVERWRAVAKSVTLQTERRLPTFALLQTTAKRRLDEWKRFAPPNRPVSVQALGSQTGVDAAVRLAIAAPTAQQDQALAMQYRPVLLFDRREPVPRPLSITALFNEKRVRLCDDRGLATSCGEPITDPRLLESGGTHLRLDLPDADRLHREALADVGTGTTAAAEPAPATGAAAEATLPEGLVPSGTVAPEDEQVASQSAIYVHPSSVTREGKELLYLDYWWYLPYNPVKLGGGALCGAGLVIAGVTCQNHESDWEGVTVVVDRTGKVPEPVAVQYAQHSNVVRFSWSLLRERWDHSQEVKSRIASLGDASSRPLVFVAVGTHASYPLPCGKGCRQFPDPGIPEEPHLGDLPWSGDDTSACGKSSCLQVLPTHEGGRQPALWNGYDGAWGEVDCFLTYYCDSGAPPTSPGNQRRYRHPTWFDGYAGTDWHFHDAPSAE